MEVAAGRRERVALAGRLVRRLAASAGPTLVGAGEVERPFLAAGTGAPLWTLERETGGAPEGGGDPELAAAGVEVCAPPEGTREAVARLRAPG